MKMRLILLVALSSTSTAFAEDRAIDGAACKPVVEACRKAGFEVGHHEVKDGRPGGKGLWIDCIGAVAKGNAVTGVNFSQDAAKACMASKKGEKEHKK